MFFPSVRVHLRYLFTIHTTTLNITGCDKLLDVLTLVNGLLHRLTTIDELPNSLKDNRCLRVLTQCGFGIDTLGFDIPIILCNVVVDITGMKADVVTNLHLVTCGFLKLIDYLLGFVTVLTCILKTIRVTRYNLDSLVFKLLDEHQKG